MKKGTFGKSIACGLCAISFAAILSCNDGTNVGGANTDTAKNASTGDSSMGSTAGTVAVANLTGTYADTTVNGTVRFETEADGEVKMKLDLTIPAKANQSVAVHIHEHGDCGDTAHHAGGHWNPTNAQHGKWGSASFHIGDIGNVTLDAGGKGSLELETRLWSIGGDAQKDILNKTIIVHGGTDDYTSQPSGNSGTRIACGVISKS
jgi:Cu-Zn family superoxide dismutase